MSTLPGVVTFDPNAFVAQFPAFATTSDDTLQMYFDMACAYLDNTPCSAVSDLTRRQLMLYLITAHIAFLLNRAAGNGGANAGAVGQMTSASEGGVSVSLAPIQAKNGAFWQQSQYGLLFWQMSLPYRSFRYMAAPYVCR